MTAEPPSKLANEVRPTSKYFFSGGDIRGRERGVPRDMDESAVGGPAFEVLYGQIEDLVAEIKPSVWPEMGVGVVCLRAASTEPDTPLLHPLHKPLGREPGPVRGWSVRDNPHPAVRRGSFPGNVD
jgi:hypothetical protein